MKHVGKRFDSNQSYVTVHMRNVDVRASGGGANVLAELRAQAEVKAAKNGKSLTGSYASRIDKKHGRHVVQFAVS